ncbi:MAG TPA: L-threonylcarbamoyladenylate synthase [Geminicoccaceae bacterium]|nr:L-threonylcarbamoyladenylate synthase [Geminicoccaceae bacterium]
MTRLLPPTPDAIREAARLLRNGRLVAFPTETVYGLGALATSDAAIHAVYAAKRRPRHNPLILHLARAEDVAAVAVVDPRAAALAHAFWPGPLTMVLPLRPQGGVSPVATAGLPTVAVRVPAHDVAHRLLAEVGAPVAAPSANPSGRLSPTTAAHVAADLAGRVELVLDAGPCPVGVESTVIDLGGAGPARLLRAGGLARERLERILGPLAPAETAGEAPRSPGQLASHYAPDLPLRLGATSVAADEALLAFGPTPPAGARATLNLSPTADLAEAAANLFAMLRRLDRSGARRIAVMPVPEEGLGEAINDRLRRAAAPRSR